jgi:O-antigen/teichoic acid export membrane protein
MAGDARRAASSAGGGLAGRLVVLALGLVSVAITTRYLGAERYGHFALALSLTQLFAVLADAGLTTVLVRELARDPGRAGSLLGSALALRGALSAAAIAAAGLAALVLPYPPDVRVAVLIAGVPLALGLANSAFVAVAQAELRAGRAAAADVVGRGAGLLALAVVATLDLGFYAVVWAAAIGAAVGLVATIALTRRLLPAEPRADRATARFLLLAALPVGLTLAVNEAYFRADALIISVSRSYEELGAYALAWRIGEVAAVIPAAVLVAVLPLLARYLAEDDPRRHPAFQTAWDLLAVLALAIAAGGALVAGELARTLGGDEFAPAADPLRILLAAASLGFVGGLLGNALIARDRQRTALALSLGALIVNVALNIALVPSLGIEAAAWVSLGCEAALLAGATVLVRRHVGLAASPAVLVRALPAVALMMLVVWPLRDEPLWLSVPAGVVVYTGALAAFGVARRLRASAAEVGWA